MANQDPEREDVGDDFEDNIDNIMNRAVSQYQKQRDQTNDFLANIERSVRATVARTKATRGQGPQKPPQFEQDDRELGKFGLTRDQANQMDPLQLFGMLQGNVRRNILDPKRTGVKVGKVPPLPLELAKRLDSIVEDAVGLEGFNSFIHGWSYYEGGNFNNVVNDYFGKKAAQVGRAGYSDVISNMFVKHPALKRVIQATIKAHDMGRSDLSRLIDKDGDHDEDWFRNDDYEDYNAADRYGLIYDDDGNYNFSNVTRRTTNQLVKNVIEREAKPEKKRAKDIAKEIDRFFKK